MPAIRITVRTTGGLFKGNTSTVIDAFSIAAKEAVAQEAVNLLHIYLDRVLQNPTGYYRSKIQQDRIQKSFVVSDSGVIYGGWLEGISSRNLATRFKGYHAFRKVKQDINKVAPEIAHRILPPYLDRLN